MVEARTALIAGASGLVGSHCLDALLRHYERVIALTRRRLAVEHSRLDQRIMDFEQLEKEEIQADDVFSALGGQSKMGAELFEKLELHYPAMLAKKAAEGGARQFAYVSSVDVNVSAHWRRYTKMKRDAEQAIIKQKFESVHIFRPGLMYGDREKRRIGEELLYQAMRPFGWVFRGRWRKSHPIAGRDVGHAMVQAALKREPGAHVYYFEEIRALAGELDSAFDDE